MRTFAAFLAAALMATPAAAESLKDPPSRATPRAAAAAPAPAAEFNWTGFYIGMDAGYQVGDNRLKGFDSRSGFDLDGLSTDGFVYGGRLGGDVQFRGTPFVVGAFGVYNQGKAEFDLDVWSGPTTANVLHATIEPNWGVGGRAGVVLYNSALLYGGWMYRWADLRVGSGVLGFVPIDRKLKGQSLIAGLEVPVTKVITVGLEYQYTWYDSVNLLPADARQRLDLDAESHAFMARVTLRAPVTSLPGFAVASPGN